MADLPPPPPGFTLDQPGTAVPPPPPGFTLDSAGTAPAALAPPPQTIPNPNQAAAEIVTGPKSGANQQQAFGQQQDIERRLRAAGKTDQQIESNPQWQAAARDLNRSVSAGATGTALGAAVGDVGGAAIPAIKQAAGPVGRALAPVFRTIDRAFPGATSRALGTLSNVGDSTTASDLGDQMHSTIMKRLMAAKTARQTGVQRDLANAFGSPQTAAPIRDKFKAALDEIGQTADQHLDEAERRLLAKTTDEISKPKSLEALDKMRRGLDSLANAKWEGAEAIPKAFARQLGDKLTNIMQTENPAFKTYIDNYRSASEPINLYQRTALGKATTGEAAGMPARDPALIPDRFFKTEQSMALLKQLSGDPAFVDSSARIHAASKLDGITQGKPIAGAARIARSWINKNQAWLDQVPEVKASAEKYVANLEATAKTKKVLRVGAALSAVPFLYEVGPWAAYRAAHLVGMAP